MGMRAFLFYIDDWLSSKHVRRMDAYEERGYLRLLLHAASEPDCGLPTDPVELADISLLGEQWFEPTKDLSKRFRGQTSGDKILACFHEENGRYFNARLLKEFQHQQEVRKKRKEASEKGVAARERNHMDNQMVNHVEENARTERLTNDVCVCVSNSTLSENIENAESLQPRARSTSPPNATANENEKRKPSNVTEMPLPLPSPGNTIPLTTAAVREWFPLADEIIVEKIACGVWGSCGGATDEEIAEAVQKTHIDGQKTPGFWLRAAPEYIKAKREGRLKARDPGVRPDGRVEKSRTAAEIREAC